MEGGETKEMHLFPPAPPMEHVHPGDGAQVADLLFKVTQLTRGIPPVQAHVAPS